jgi:phage protein D
MPDVGTFEVLRNNSALPQKLIDAICSVRVVKEINVPSMFELTLTMQSAEGVWQNGNLEQFKPGDEFSIKLGLDKPRELMIGRITAIEPSYGDYSTVMVRGFDAMHSLRFGTHTRTFLKQSEHGIVAEVARSAKLTVTTKGKPGAVYPYVLQNNESNYAFLLKRCAQCNYELMIDGKTLIFRPSAQGDSSVRTLKFPADVDALDLALNVPTLGASVKAVGYDIATNRAITAEASSPTSREKMGGKQTGYDVAGQFPPSATVVERLDMSSPQALEDLAKAHYEQYLSGFIQGTARLVGDPQVTAGVNIKLDGLSERFDGIYYVTASTHSYVDTAYSTEIALKRSGI